MNTMTGFLAAIALSAATLGAHANEVDLPAVRLPSMSPEAGSEAASGAASPFAAAAATQPRPTLLLPEQGRASRAREVLLGVPLDERLRGYCAPVGEDLRRDSSTRGAPALLAAAPVSPPGVLRIGSSPARVPAAARARAA